MDRRQGGYWGSGDDRDGGDEAVALLDGGGGDRSAGWGALRAGVESGMGYDEVAEVWAEIFVGLLR